MKYIQIIPLLLVITLRGFSQDTIVPVRLYLTTNYTTNLVFPYEIVKADVGSPDILLQKSGSMNNVLLIKAGIRNFSPTNLSIYTKDGTCYSYRLLYADTLSVFIQSYRDQRDWSAHRLFRYRTVCKDGLLLELTDIYSRGGLLWMQFQVWNRSSADYTIGSVRFCIRDRKRTRKMVIQEETWVPLYVAQPACWVAGSHVQFQYGFPPRFPNGKREIMAEWADEHGERRIRMTIPVKWLIRTHEKI